VGPEAPLVAGVVDHFEARPALLRSLRRRSAARGLQGLQQGLPRPAHIPTAAYATFSELEPALAYLRERGAPIVVKADGLAAGKGVIVAGTLARPRRR
jgi:phosphoribosylamine--glycine ligase